MPRPLRHNRLIALALAVLAIGGCVADGLGPRSASSPGIEPTPHVYREVGDQQLRAFVFQPARSARSPAPAILLFHGGGWVAGSAEWTFERAQRFAQMGLVAISIDYRLSDGAVTPIEALEDTCQAFRWVRNQADRLAINPEKVAGFGVSAGGHLVATAATRGCGDNQGGFGNGGPDALILWSPALDVGNDGWFQRLTQGRAGAKDYSPVDNMPTRLAPTCIVQGAEDTLTPLEGARRFCELSTANGNRCELHVYPAVGHLLTRNLADQESNYDPDPASRADGIARQERFLCELWRPLNRGCG
jgi:acetyl esterase/lipase